MARFTTTHWSVILQAGQADADRARQALEHVCQRYWYPLYAYARRFGYDSEAAKDVTQAFFSHLIENKIITRVNPAAGRFRTFLLTSLKNHFLSQRKRDAAQKRGSGYSMHSLDELAGEARFGSEPSDGRSPDRLFERSWAMNLLEQALQLLEQEYAGAGQKSLFDQLHPVLIQEETAPVYREIADRLGIKEGTVKVAAYRLRQRYREILTGLVASTIPDPAEVDQELRFLLKVIS